jgi:hypothetical protein
MEQGRFSLQGAVNCLWEAERGIVKTVERNG